MADQSVDPNYIHIKATLRCGTQVEVIQPEPHMNFNFIFTPKPGVTVQDFADFKNGALNVRMTDESLVGLYQLLRWIIDPKSTKIEKKSNFWKELFE